MQDDLKVPSANEWGHKRADFYVTPTSRVREDGNLNDEEQELLDLEENDAVERQHKLDSINSFMDPKKLASFADVSDDDESDGDIQPAQETKKISYFRPSSGQFKRITLTKKKREPPREVPTKQEVSGGDVQQEKREIGYDIQKNKGLVQKRKKDAKHSRVKRRAQYKKALVKRRSQVPDVKREMSKYSGESRGIRMSTVRSIPLKG